MVASFCGLYDIVGASYVLTQLILIGCAYGGAPWLLYGLLSGFFTAFAGFFLASLQALRCSSVFTTSVVHLYMLGLYGFFTGVGCSFFGLCDFVGASYVWTQLILIGCAYGGAPCFLDSQLVLIGCAYGGTLVHWLS